MNRAQAKTWLEVTKCVDGSCPKKNKCERYHPYAYNDGRITIYYVKTPGYWEGGEHKCDMFLSF